MTNDAPATVKVRIAVAVDPSGAWSASGWKSEDRNYEANAMGSAIEGVEEGEARYWLEAELAVPKRAAADPVQATVTEAK